MHPIETFVFLFTAVGVVLAWLVGRDPYPILWF